MELKFIARYPASICLTHQLMKYWEGQSLLQILFSDSKNPCPLKMSYTMPSCERREGREAQPGRYVIEKAAQTFSPLSQKTHFSALVGFSALLAVKA